MQSRILFHIGYPKTGTTWMQRKLFVQKYGFEQVASHVDVDTHVVFPHGFDFNPDGMRTLLESRASQIHPISVPVVSSEILAGQPFFGGISSDIYALRIREICPSARILITIRSQESILVSTYMQHLLRGGTLTPAQFFNPRRTIGYYSFRPEFFEYDKLVSYYFSLFGRENVLIQTQESLAKGPNRFASQIASFCENHALNYVDKQDLAISAKSYPEYAAPVLRRVNHIQDSVLNANPVVSLGETPGSLYWAIGYVLKRPMLSKSLSGWTPVTDYVKKAFKGCYTPSNQRLSELVPYLDLSDYP